MSCPFAASGSASLWLKQRLPKVMSANFMRENYRAKPFITIKSQQKGAFRACACSIFSGFC
jgi:hypothetical protein